MEVSLFVHTERRERFERRGAIEAIFSLLAIRDQIAPPTINLDDPAYETVVDLVPNKAKPMK